MPETPSLIERLRSSAKALRENPVYDSEGDGMLLTVQADELDEAARQIETLRAQVAALPNAYGVREALARMLAAYRELHAFYGPTAIEDFPQYDAYSFAEQAFGSALSPVVEDGVTRQALIYAREECAKRAETNGAPEMAAQWRCGHFDNLPDITMRRDAYFAGVAAALAYRGDEGVPLAVIKPVIEGAHEALSHLARILPTEPGEVRLAAAYAATEAARLAAAIMLLTPTALASQPSPIGGKEGK